MHLHAYQYIVYYRFLGVIRLLKWSCKQHNPMSFIQKTLKTLSDYEKFNKRTRWHFSVQSYLIPCRPPLSLSYTYCRVVTKRSVNRCSSCLKNYGIDLYCATITDKIKYNVIDWPSGEVCDKTVSCCLLRPVSESSGRIRSETYSELPLKLIDHFMWSQFWKLCLIQSAKEVETHTYTHLHTRVHARNCTNGTLCMYA